MTVDNWLCPSVYAASKGADPVAYWRFDEGGGGTAYDESANNNDGVLTPGTLGTNTAAGQMWTRQGKIGGALELDGTDDQVSTGAFSAAIGPSYTLALWVYPRGYIDIVSSNASQWIQQAGGVFQDAGFSSTNKFYVGMYINSTYYSYNSGTLTIPLNQWSFIAYTLSGQTLTFYLNDESYSQTIAAGTVNTTANVMRIGNYSTAAYHFNGFIDDVRIYNYSRSQDQVLVDYNAGSAVHLGAGIDPNEGNPPVGYWTLDENTGTNAYDRSGGGFDGTIYNSPSWVNGQRGNALQFNGTNQYVSIPDNASLDSFTAITLEAWVKLGDNPTYPDHPGGRYATIVGKSIDDGYQLRMGGDSGAGQFGFGVKTGASFPQIYTTEKYGTGVWYHVVATYDGTNLKLYVNGELRASGASSGSLPNTTYPVEIGRRTNGYNFAGIIDDVKVYNYARTQAQITYDYSRGAPVAHYKFDEGGGAIAKNKYSSADTGAAPIGWWRMDEGTGGTTTDSSGNAKTGTLYPGTLGTNTTTALMWDQTGKIGPKCLEFDGTDDYVALGTVGGYSNNITIEAWIKKSGVNTDWDDIVAGGCGDVLFGLSSNYLNWGGQCNSPFGMTTSTMTLNDGAWHHVTGTYDGTTVKLYVDGALNASTARTGSFTPGNIGIGCNGGAGEFFNGLIDDVRIYNYARTAEQIYNDYKTTHGTLVGDTKFVDGKIGKALQFDGSGDWVVVDVDSWIRKCDYVTITGWYYHTADTNGAPWGIMTNTAGGTGDGFWWHIKYTGNAFYLRTEDNINGESDGTGTPFVSAGNWYHIATVIGTNTFKVYKDGVLYWSWAPNNNFSWVNVNSDPAYFFIGRSYYDDTTGVNGKIDDVNLYNYERTVAQIAQDYNAGVVARLGVPSAGVADPWGGALPVAHWKLDENTGVLAYDASGNGNNGTLGGDGAGADIPTWTQGKNGPCLSFDGDDYVSLNPVNPPSYVSVTGWFKRKGPSSNTHHIVFMQDTQIEISIPESTGAIRTGVTTATLGRQVFDSGSGLTDGNWHFVGLTYDGTYLRSYIDGIQTANNTVSGALSTGAATNIGKYGTYYANGFIDDVRIYNYARTQAQIAWDYNQGKPAGHWRFDGGNGATAYDESDNNNDGTITIGATGTQTTVASAWANGATGKFGKCMSFDGTDDYVNCGNGSSLNFAEGNEWTVSSWIKTSANYTGANGGKKPVLKGTGGAIAGYAVAIGQLNSAGYDNKVGFVIDKSPGNNYVASTNSLPLVNDGNWHHVAIVFDAKNNVKVGGTIYFDGVSYGYVNSVVDKAGWSADTSQALKIGGQSGEYFTGLIDDTRIYNYARTTEQVKQDYLNGAAARLGD